MTKKEFAILIATLENTYKSQPATKETMRIWYECLKDLDYLIAHKAVEKIIMTNKFYPSIADIREAAYEVLNGPQITGEKAWEIFKNYINLYSTESDYKRLKEDYPEIHRISSHIGARELLLGNLNFVRPEFERIFNQHQKSVKENKLLPESYKTDVMKLRGDLYHQELIEQLS